MKVVKQSSRILSTLVMAKSFCAYFRKGCNLCTFFIRGIWKNEIRYLSRPQVLCHEIVPPKHTALLNHIVKNNTE